MPKVLIAREQKNYVSAYKKPGLPKVEEAKKFYSSEILWFKKSERLFSKYVLLDFNGQQAIVFDECFQLISYHAFPNAFGSSGENKIPDIHRKII